MGRELQSLLETSKEGLTRQWPMNRAIVRGGLPIDVDAMSPPKAAGTIVQGSRYVN